jgi:hypothetical protein
MIDEIRHVLDGQLDKLSALEMEIMICLALVREPMSLQTLWDQLKSLSSRHALIKSLHNLQHHALIESWEGQFSLQAIVAEHITAYWGNALPAGSVSQHGCVQRRQ